MTKKTLNPISYDVLIVGAGPTGLTLALTLAVFGLKIKIIDKKNGPSEHSKGIAIHALSLETLQNLGITKTIVEQGKRLWKINGYFERRQKTQIDLRQGINSSFSYVLILEQNKLEKILIEALKTRGIDVDWNTELDTFTQTASEVTATVFSHSNKETITSDWIVGSDGPQSKVRECLGIKYEGNSYPEKFILADVSLDWNLPKNDGYSFIEANGLLLVLPLGNNLSRIVTVINVNEKEDDILKALQTKFNLLSPVKATLSDPQWISSFHIHRKITKKMKVGRAFIAGDAAHIFSPIGGQGMNTGIQDAYNLGWKLGYSYSGLVDNDFLQSYEEERLETAHHVLTGTNLAMRVLFTRSTFWRKVRDIVGPVLINFNFVQTHLKRIVSQTTLHYRNSSVIHREDDYLQRFARQIKEAVIGGVNLGDYAHDFPLLTPKEYKKHTMSSLTQGTQHTMLVFLGDNPKELITQHNIFKTLMNNINGIANAYFIVGEHAIDYNEFNPDLPNVYIDPDGKGHKQYKCSTPTLYLIRPDRYVAYKGSTEDKTFMAYINKFFHKPKEESTAKKTA